MGVEFRVLGPLEVLVDGGRRGWAGRASARCWRSCSVHANEVVPVARLIDEVWGDDPPVTAANVLQGYVSQLRKALGRDAIGTRGRGYASRVPDGALDLRGFERRAAAGARARADGRSADAAAELRAALALWRGPALSDLVDGAVRADCRRAPRRAAPARRSSGRSRPTSRCGRDAEPVAELDGLVAEHPLRERLRALQMLALYRAGRQADALEAYRVGAHDARRRARHRAGRRAAATSSARSSSRTPASLRRAPRRPARRSRRSAPRDGGRAALDSAPSLLALGRRRSPAGRSASSSSPPRWPARRSSTAPSRRLARAARRARRRGVTARSAAFTSVTPGRDLTRLAAEQDVELLARRRARTACSRTRGC